MIWLCLICNTENNISEADYENEKKARYCKFCRNLDSLCYASYDRRQYLLDQYLQINEKIDQLIPTNEKYPKIEITSNFLNQFNLSNHLIYSYYNPNKDSILRHIRYRIYYNSVNSWRSYRKRLSKKRYKKLLKDKFSKALPIRPMNCILEFF